MAKVVLDGAGKRYAHGVGLYPTDLEIPDTEFVSLLGPSGCGKTTTLRLIAGFLQPTEGRILMGEEDVTHVAPQHRTIGMVFQNYALFPHLTVAENIGFGLRERGQGTKQVRERVGDLLDLIRLPGVGERYPSELSGGQQQRVALARAVAYPPRLLLMDEPLGALDLKMREAMQGEIRRIQKNLGITTVYVTHDQTEAISLSDRIAVMNQGRIQQLGTGAEIYNHPRSKFVADFVGSINFLPVRILGRDGTTVSVEMRGHRMTALTSFVEPDATTPVTMALRPERIKLMAPGSAHPAGWNSIEGVVSSSMFVGSSTGVEVKVGGDLTLKVEIRPDDFHAGSGEKVLLTWDPAHVTLLPDD